MKMPATASSVKTSDETKNTFMKFHKGSLAHFQVEKETSTYHTVADFLKLLAVALKYKVDEDASVKALSKYRALCVCDMLDDGDLANLD